MKKESMTEEQHTLMCYKKQQERIKEHMDKLWIWRGEQKGRFTDRIYKFMDKLDEEGRLTDIKLERIERMLARWI